MKIVGIKLKLSNRLKLSEHGFGFLFQISIRKANQSRCSLFIRFVNITIISQTVFFFEQKFFWDTSGVDLQRIDEVNQIVALLLDNVFKNFPGLIFLLYFSIHSTSKNCNLFCAAWKSSH